MTDTPTPPAEAVEIASYAIRNEAVDLDGDVVSWRAEGLGRGTASAAMATAALTALAAAGWTLTPPGKLAKARAAYKARAGTYQLTDDGWTRVPASKP